MAIRRPRMTLQYFSEREFPRTEEWWHTLKAVLTKKCQLQVRSLVFVTFHSGTWTFQRHFGRDLYSDSQHREVKNSAPAALYVATPIILEPHFSSRLSSVCHCRHRASARTSLS